MQIERDKETEQGLLLLNSKIPEIILNSTEEYYISLDNGFLNFFFSKGFSQNKDDLWRWLSGGLKNISDTTRFISDNTPYRIHRFFTIPFPSYIENSYFRNYYRFVIKNMLHYHMSNGVVCYVVFVNPYFYFKKTLLRTSDVVTFISEKLNYTFNFSNLYTSKKNKDISINESSIGKKLVHDIYNEFQVEDLKGCIRSYYDMETYSNLRLRNSSHNFNSIRKLTYSIYDGVCQGIDCAKKLNFNESHIDHIIPIRFSNNTLCNMNLLCEKCNKYKSDKFFRNNFAQDDQINFLPLFAKETHGLNDIFRNTEIPSWVNKFESRPLDVRSFIS